MTMHDLYQTYLDQQTQLKQISKTGYAGTFRILPDPDQLGSEFFRNMSESVSPVTLRQRLTLTRKFLRWWSDNVKSKAEQRRIESILKDIKTVKPKRPEESVTVENLYTPEQLRSIFGACADVRDLAMFQVLYESGCRAGELLSMTIERVTFLPDGRADVIVDGKTGTRQVPLYVSVPSLKNWINSHPVGKGRLWVTMRKPIVPLKYSGLYNHTLTILDRAGVTANRKKILHMFRHTRVTEVRNHGVTGSPLWKLFGWKDGSMEKVYEHLSTADVTREMKEKVFGIVSGSDKPIPFLNLTECPKCHEKNDAKARVCAKCNLPLSTELIVQGFLEKDEMAKRLDKLEFVIRKVAENAGVTQSELEAILGPSEPLWSDTSPDRETPGKAGEVYKRQRDEATSGS